MQAEEEANRARIEIPVKEGGELVVVYADELPTDASDILFILREEEATRQLFLKFALEYFRQGQVQAFEFLLKEGLKDDGGELAYMRQHDHAHPRQKIALHNTQASYLLQQMSTCSLSVQDKQRMSERVTQCFQESDRIDIRDLSTWLGKGMLLMYGQHNWEKAQVQFKLALTEDPDNINGMLGMAAVMYHRKEYMQALRLYQRLYKVMRRTNSDTNVDARIGIGLCLAAMGELEMSERALAIALKSNPNNVALLAMLAAVYFNLARKDPKSAAAHTYVQTAVGLLKRGQVADKEYPAITAQLADILFQRGDYEKCLKLIQQAQSRTGSQDTKALLSFYAGRVHHAQKNFNEALQHYNIAHTMGASENHVLLYCMAQVLIQTDQFKDAQGYLEQLIKLDPKNKDASRLLGFVYAQLPEHHDVAIELLKTVTTENPSDSDAFAELARLLESKDLSAAVAAYQRLNNMMLESGEVSLHMLNNLGVVLFSSGDLKGAEKTLDTAFQRLSAANDDTPAMKHLKVTVMYNLGRLYEFAHKDDLEKALKIYKDVLAIDAEYVDALLRLGYIAQSQNRMDDAVESFKDVLGVQSENASAWISLGNLDLNRKLYKQSRGSFERVLKKIDANDEYCLAASGNDRLLAAQSIPDPAAKRATCKEALKFFDKAMRKHAGNGYAAHGIAIAFAEMGMMSDAKDSLSKVREACPHMQQPQINLAHVMVEMNQYHAALALYDSVNRKFHDGMNTQYLLFSARACYMVARNDKNHEDMLKCIDLLDAILKQSPADKVAMFDKALAMQQFAQLVSDIPTEQRTVAILEKGQDFNDQSQKMFDELATVDVKEAKILGYDVGMAQQRGKHANFIRSSITRKISLQTANEKDREEALDELKRIRTEYIRAREEAEKAEEARKLLEREKLLIHRTEVAESLRVQMLERKEVTPAKKEPKKKRTRTESKEEGEDGETVTKKKKKKSRPSKADQIDKDMPDEQQPAAEEETESRRVLSRPKKSALSEEIIASTDDEDDEPEDHVPRGNVMAIEDDEDEEEG